MREEEADDGSAASEGVIILEVKEAGGSGKEDFRMPVGLERGRGMSMLPVSAMDLPWPPVFVADKLSAPIKSCNFLRGSDPSGFLL